LFTFAAHRAVIFTIVQLSCFDKFCSWVLWTTSCFVL